MWKILSVVMPIIIGTILTQDIDLTKFQQHDYHVVLERAYVPSYETRYMNQASITSFRYNRTTIAMNGTYNYKINVGNDLEAVVQVYKFLSNEYRPFPIRFSINFCKALKADAAGLKKLMLCGNFDGCPIRVNSTIHVCNFIPTESNLPPHIPNGRYLLETNSVFQSRHLYYQNLYFAIMRPEV